MGVSLLSFKDTTIESSIMKATIQAVNDGAMFLITKTDNSGKETVMTENALAVVDNKGIAQFLNQAVKNEGYRRAAFQSLLASVFANPKLDGYKGKGDNTTGKTSKELKASIRACEDMFFSELLEAKLLKIPHSDNPEKAFQSYCTSIREDKNYSNIKSTVAKYYAFVGANCKTESGFLVPHAVMLEQIKSVMNLDPVDNSIAGKLRAIRAELDKIEIDYNDTKDSLDVANSLVSLLKGILSHHDELATNLANAPTLAKTVPTIAANAIAVAKKQQSMVEPALV
jgi:hypothetical protein